MKTRLLFIFGLVSLLALALAGSASAAPPAGDFAVIQAAADKYLTTVKSPVISADALWENLNDGDKSNDPFILSVRSPADYAKGHIPGAVNIPWKDVARPESLAKLPKDRQIVVYCYTGHTGQIATTVLNLLGYNAINLKYGMMGWTKDDTVLAQPRFGPTTDQRDYKLETTANTTTATYSYPELNTGAKGDFEVIRAAADRWLNTAKNPVMGADAIWENLNDGDKSNDPFILSVRSPADYAKGHIPGAVNIPWKDIARPENLAKLPPNKPLAVYCYTGHTGQVATTILGLLGYDAHNIKYGMMGWSKDDTVLAQARFGPTTEQRDYKLEKAATAAAPAPAAPAAAPAPLPKTGGEAIPAGLPLVLAGLIVLLGGLTLRRR